MVKVSNSEKILALRRMLSNIGPLVKQLHEEQDKEVQLEMNLKGVLLYLNKANTSMILVT